MLGLNASSQSQKTYSQQIKEQLAVDIDNLLDTYRHSQLSPFFVMYLKKGCGSPCIAMLTSQSVWNNRSVKAYLLPHNQPVPPGQFNDTSVRVPKNSGLCASRGCNCFKQHMEKLDKLLILNILVEEKQEGRDTVLRSVFPRKIKTMIAQNTMFFTCLNHKSNFSLISIVVELTQ